MNDLISRQAIREAMYHEAMEKDSDEQKWDSGCWIRYKMFERVLEALPSAQPEQRWISCEERLPEKHEEVLVTVEGEIMIAWLCSDGRWRSNDCPEAYLNDYIIAWMPLPEPYKGENE